MTITNVNVRSYVRKDGVCAVGFMRLLQPCELIHKSPCLSVPVHA